MILDYIENLKLPDNLKPKFPNELQSLNLLQQGLNLLYRNTRAIEQKAQKQANNGGWLQSTPPEVRKTLKGKNMRVVSAGNGPVLKGLPQHIVYCFFQWYSVSACNYVWLVGWILEQVDSNRPTPRKYVNSVIPNVLWFRNKIGAHHAITRKHNDDTEADRAASIMYQLGFDNGRFYAPFWKVTKRRSGKESTTDTQQWSLTEIHEKLTERYWPKEVRK